MPTLTIVTIIAVLVWLVIAFFARQFRKQFFWMGFLATALIGASLLLNTAWIVAAAPDPYFWYWIAQILILVFVVASLGAIAYEWIFHIHWQRPKHRHHHHVGLLVIGPLVVVTGFFILPFAAIHLLLIGIAVEVALLLFVRSDLIVDGLFSGLFMGLLISLLFSFFFGTIPGSFFESWQLSGLNILGLPAELIIFFFLFGVLWGPWYEVVKDYHPRHIQK